ncbi:MAG: chemotaxis-specific protein-glutamate methyltransferase CheB [Polyangiaceae bacterium]|nr:chemotaxis-specific protein-glutamate methyltransferase CheB [Polyangiaceae bacterium]
MKIAIATNSAHALAVLRRALAERRHEVDWIAQDAADLVQRCAKRAPNLLLLDCEIASGGDGSAARLMATTPCPIVIVSRDVAAHAGRIFEALGAGALDVVNVGADHTEARVMAISVGSRIDMNVRLLRDASAPARAPEQARSTPLSPRPPSDTDVARLLVIGASVGGPQAIATILGGLPRDFPAAIVVVQHVDAEFAPMMATWFGSQCELPVRIAQEGDIPLPGTVLVAGGDEHLAFVDEHRLGHAKPKTNSFYRPSIDVFFESAVAFRGVLIAVLLTGMGRDGARGLRELRDAGAHTIAQDRGTSAVYGMPKAAVELGAAVEVLPLDRIAPRIATLIGARRCATGPMRATRSMARGEGGERG